VEGVAAKCGRGQWIADDTQTEFCIKCFRFCWNAFFFYHKSVLLHVVMVTPYFVYFWVHYPLQSLSVTIATLNAETLEVTYSVVNLIGCLMKYKESWQFSHPQVFAAILVSLAPNPAS
jgi:hypothetical protein